MVRLYGKTTKFIRHQTDQSYTVGDGETMQIPFWYANDSATTRVDGQDLQDEFGMPIGSKITKHKLDITITPTTENPQEIYIGRLKLSFHDVLNEEICGMEFDATAYETGYAATAVSGAHSVVRFYPDKDNHRAVHISAAYSADDINAILVEDKLKHFLGLNKVVVFNQRPLMGSRWQKIPAKVKRINPYTWYGLVVHNASPTAAEDVTVRVKQYIEEWAL